jgi:hypothetical protein
VIDVVKKFYSPGFVSIASPVPPEERLITIEAIAARVKRIFYASHDFSIKTGKISCKFYIAHA